MLFAPIYLQIDSTKAVCKLKFHHIASVSIRIYDEKLFIELRIVKWTKQFNLLAANKNKPSVYREKRIHPKRATKPIIPWKRMQNVIKSFRINDCKITIDTGNVQANALLFPIVYWMQIKSKKDISINFTGKNIIVLEIQNNLARMSWAYFSS
jgi:hypothetical protein